MKKVKILTITLAIILIAMIAFWGIYVPTQNRMTNKVEGYSYAMDLKGTRNIKLKAEETDTEEETNSEEETDTEGEATEETTEDATEDVASNENKENYQKSKEIIEKRLKKMGVDNYIVKLDEQTGDILVEIPENDDTDTIVSTLGTTGKFEIIDTETEEVLMDNNDIKLANVMYSSSSSSSTTTTSGTTVYLNIEFTKDGAKKLEEISSKYVENTEDSEDTSETSEESEETDTEETTEETEAEDTTTEDTATEDTESSEETSTEKTITMKIDDEEIMTTSFDETIRTGKLQLSIGSSTTDTDTLQGYISQASNMAVVLDTGNIPTTYEVEENQYVLSDITNNNLTTVAYVIAGITAIALIILIIRYKTLGVIGTISYIGLISIFLLVIRYANVVLSIEGIFGIAIILILNYIFTNQVLSKIKNKEIDKSTVKKAVKETYKEFFIKIVPICIAVITFCFISWEPISSFGMVMFWGIALIAIYNIIVTNNLLKIKASK